MVIIEVLGKLDDRLFSIPLPPNFDSIRIREVPDNSGGVQPIKIYCSGYKSVPIPRHHEEDRPRSHPRGDTGLR